MMCYCPRKVKKRDFWRWPWPSSGSQKGQMLHSGELSQESTFETRALTYLLPTQSWWRACFWGDDVRIWGQETDECESKWKEWMVVVVEERKVWYSRSGEKRCRFMRQGNAVQVRWPFGAQPWGMGRLWCAHLAEGDGFPWWGTKVSIHAGLRARLGMAAAPVSSAEGGLLCTLLCTHKISIDRSIKARSIKLTI